MRGPCGYVIASPPVGSSPSCGGPCGSPASSRRALSPPRPPPSWGSLSLAARGAPRRGTLAGPPLRRVPSGRRLPEAGGGRPRAEHLSSSAGHCGGRSVGSSRRPPCRLLWGSFGVGVKVCVLYVSDPKITRFKRQRGWPCVSEEQRLHSSWVVVVGSAKPSCRREA